VGSVLTTFVESRRKVDESLRTSREPAYKELWGLTSVFRFHPGRFNRLG
jgi:hypothetical protein